MDSNVSERIPAKGCCTTSDMRRRIAFTFWGLPAGRDTLDCALAHLYQPPLSWGRCKIMCLVMPKTHGGGDGGVDGSWELGAGAVAMGNAPSLQSLDSLRLSCWVIRVWGKMDYAWLDRKLPAV